MEKEKNGYNFFSEKILNDFFISEVSEENKYLFKRLVKDAALNFDKTAKENLVNFQKLKLRL